MDNLKDNITLYQIDAAIKSLDEIICDPETGEINEDAYADFEQLMIDKAVKVENIGMLIKNLEAEADVEDAKAKPFEEEAAKYKKSAKSLRSKATWYKGYLSTSLNGETFDGNYIKIRYRKSQAVEIKNPDIVPAEYQKHTPDIAAIRIALKLKPDSVPGAELVDRQNIQIK